MTRFLSTPSARRATDDPEKYPDIPEFLSTPSARRATEGPEQPGQWPRYFYPRPPRGGRLVIDGGAAVRNRISIHALREEGDTLATHQDQTLFISIHALREEGDHRHRGRWRHRRISIHALREEGDAQTKLDIAKQAQFLSTPSARRATLN